MNQVFDWPVYASQMPVPGDRPVTGLVKKSRHHWSSSANCCLWLQVSGSSVKMLANDDAMKLKRVLCAFYACYSV